MASNSFCLKKNTILPCPTWSTCGKQLQIKNTMKSLKMTMKNFLSQMSQMIQMNPKGGSYQTPFMRFLRKQGLKKNGMDFRPQI